MTLDLSAATELVGRTWSDELVGQLCDYIAIPALSPAFDPDWEASGHIGAAVSQISEWMSARPIDALTVDVHEIEGRTPLIVAEIEPFGGDRDGGAVADRPAAVLYGHLDKQPEMVGWRDGLGPWTPVREGDLLYGRGGADDGYAAFAAMTAIEAIQRSGGSHRRLFVLIEASEESGSPDLPAHVEALQARLGSVDFVVCLDSGCATYDTLWLTTSLRGLVGGVLTVSMLTEGIHSGASGVVPSTFRIMRQLLDRIEDASSGAVQLAGANVEIPAHRVAEAKAMADVVAGSDVASSVPYLPGAGPAVADRAEALLARSWRPAFSYTGADGLPPTGSAGNVLRPSTALKLSLRLPPIAEPDAVESELRAVLESDPPYGAAVSFGAVESGPGWDAPDLAPWLRDALDQASQAAFGRPVQMMGEGGSIPFMSMLGERFPEAQFAVTGVLGPGSNAHGPNEYLHLGYAERLTGVVAQVIDAHARRS